MYRSEFGSLTTILAQPLDADSGLNSPFNKHIKRFIPSPSKSLTAVSSGWNLYQICENKKLKKETRIVLIGLEITSCLASLSSTSHPQLKQVAAIAGISKIFIENGRSKESFFLAAPHVASLKPIEPYTSMAVLTFKVGKIAYDIFFPDNTDQSFDFISEDSASLMAMINWETLAEVPQEDEVLQQYKCALKKRSIRHICTLKISMTPPLYFEKQSVTEWINKPSYPAPDRWPKELPLPPKREYFILDTIAQEVINNRLKVLARAAENKMKYFRQAKQTPVSRFDFPVGSSCED